MKHKNLIDEIELPDKVQASITGRTITVKGPKGEASKEIKFTNANAKVEGNKIMIEALDPNQKSKKNFYTLRSHIKNLVEGVNNGFTYKLKVCAGHFPMNASISGKQFIVKNFLGEKVPRVLQLKEGVTVKVEGTEVTVQGCNVETTGQVAADIEQLTRVTGRDIRIFQDGIYIVKKPE
jgi:large subunit ribosomal protein L6